MSMSFLPGLHFWGVDDDECHYWINIIHCVDSIVPVYGRAFIVYLAYVD